MAVTPRGMSVTEAYRSFRNGQFLVNRTYQRKLVWTQDEKVRLIDSLLRGYPIPLILLAQLSDGRYEIIDGMQRLNAVFSFIEQAFPINKKFFNVNEFLTAKEAASKGSFSVIENTSLLERGECASLLDYQLAVTIFPAAEESGITEIFGRINSGGKQLSPQERRQAGVIAKFPALVRKLSAELRGDPSEDVLNLVDMPAVSIDGPTFKQGYGVHSEETFWCKQGILRAKELRDSLDEQIVADLAASILQDAPFPASRENFDELYETGTPIQSEIESRLSAYGEEKLQTEIKTTFSVLAACISSVDDSPNALRRVVNPTAGANPIRTPFFAIFMSFFQLVIRENQAVSDPVRLLNALSELASRLETGSHHVNIEDRRKNINITIGLIRNEFIKSDPPLLGHGPGLLLDLENSLRRSAIESPRYEFKQGQLRLDNNFTLDNNVIIKVIQTICAIANIGSDAIGFIFFGVADNTSDAERIEEIYEIKPIQLSKAFIVGIDRECEKLNCSVEEYVRNIASRIQHSELSEPCKSDVLGNFDTICYRGLHVIRITVHSQNQMTWVGEKTFMRKNSETIEATGKAISAITERF